jgi:hypothetical protein
VGEVDVPLRARSPAFASMNWMNSSKSMTPSPLMSISSQNSSSSSWVIECGSWNAAITRGCRTTFLSSSIVSVPLPS